MSSEIMNRFLEIIEADVRSSPSPIEFAIKHTEQFARLTNI